MTRTNQGKGISHLIIIGGLILACRLFAVDAAQVNAAEPVRYKYETIFTYTGSPVEFKWYHRQSEDPSQDFPGITYELKITQFENESVALDVSGLTAMNYTWTPPRVGHFIVQVRAKKVGEDPSPWTDSRQFISKESCGSHCVEQLAFWVYAWPSPAGAGSIE